MTAKSEQAMREAQMREQFEAWVLTQGFSDFERYQDGRYMMSLIDDYWWSWQAAYAAGQASEREACAKIADEIGERVADDELYNLSAAHIADAIRSRARAGEGPLI